MPRASCRMAGNATPAFDVLKLFCFKLIAAACVLDALQHTFVADSCRNIFLQNPATTNLQIRVDLRFFDSCTNCISS